MPNDILTRAIDEICAGTHLTADHTSAALAEIMEGRASEVQTGGLPGRRCAPRARRSPSWSAWRARCGQLAAHVEIDKPEPGRHRRHGRRPDDLQHLDHGGADRRRGGLPGRQARQPLRHQPLGLRRRARGARRRHRALAGRGRPPASRRSASASCSPRSTTRRWRTSSRSARSSRCGRSSTSWARSPTRRARARHLLGVSDRSYQEIIADALLQLGCARALVVSADDGIDELSLASQDPGDRGRRRRDRGVVRRGGRPGPRAGAARRDPGRRAGRERRGRQIRPRRRAGPGARRRGAERRRRDLRRRRSRRPSGGRREGARRRSTPAPRGTCSSAWSPAPASSPARAKVPA